MGPILAHPYPQRSGVTLPPGMHHTHKVDNSVLVLSMRQAWEDGNHNFTTFSKMSTFWWLYLESPWEMHSIKYKHAWYWFRFCPVRLHTSHWTWKETPYNSRTRPFFLLRLFLNFANSYQHFSTWWKNKMVVDHNLLSISMVLPHLTMSIPGRRAWEEDWILCLE